MLLEALTVGVGGKRLHRHNALHSTATYAKDFLAVAGGGLMESPNNLGPCIRVAVEDSFCHTCAMLFHNTIYIVILTHFSLSLGATGIEGP